MVTIFLSSVALLALLLLLLLCRSLSALADLFVEYAISGAMLFLMAIAVIGGMSILLGFFEVCDIVSVVLSIVTILIVGYILSMAVSIGMTVLSIAVTAVSVVSAYLSGALDWAAAHIEQWFSAVIGLMEKHIDAKVGEA